MDRRINLNQVISFILFVFYVFFLVISPSVCVCVCVCECVCECVRRSCTVSFIAIDQKKITKITNVSYLVFVEDNGMKDTQNALVDGSTSSSSSYL